MTPTIEVSYRVMDASSDERLKDDLSLLSPEERERHDRLMFAADRRDFAAAHALVRRRLSAAGGVPPGDWRFGAAPGGKPYVANAGAPDLVCNLSHTRALVACAVARGPLDLGIDVENLDAGRNPSGIAERYFTPAERSWIAAAGEADRSIRFVELWTLKEAWLKATGAGVGAGLDAVSFGLDAGTGIEMQTREAADGDWSFVMVEPAPGYRLSVALRSSRAWPRFVIRDDAGERAATPLRWSRAAVATA